MTGYDIYNPDEFIVWLKSRGSKADVEPANQQNEALDDDFDSKTAKIVLGASAVGLMGIIGGVAWHRLKQRKPGKE